MKELLTPKDFDIFYSLLQKKKSKTKAQVDAVFFRELKKLLKIIIPGWFTAESSFCLLVAASLVARSFCDIWMIQNATLVET